MYVPIPFKLKGRSFSTTGLQLYYFLHKDNSLTAVSKIPTWM